ncbi:hypothetical protein [Novosphingobium sp. LASN5T]|uniref:hypothetical protein n=1 Tax=Novosphingobium sp. LASN5T TaxID=2491021 RepID=UPI000F5E4545|nr:hypothetical protein [Novosphingobium sp. LASN5T]RQW46138.1 hypothetical protein EH199_01975 [Novosphingobium sp. LASN5T]
MFDVDCVSLLSPRRRQLASFEHGYAIALRLRGESGLPQFIVSTSNPLQPFRVTAQLSANDEAVLALVA